ncbi:hypothetical protein [Clostridium manihotivorum]|nr:hypothetical protein [Clostridium manihotivorum]
MNLSYYHQIVYISDKLFIRNNGIFYEPCYLGMYISLFLVNELFYRDKIRLIAVIVACFNLFTTMSTTALIFVVAIFLVKFYTLKFDNRLIKLLKNIFIPIITFACGVVAIYIYISKVQGFGKLSYGIRQEDFLLGLKLFKERIIAGWGFDNLNAIIFLESSDLRGNGLGSNWGSSNGLTLLMYQGGLYFLMVYVTGIYYYFKDLYLKNKIGSLILLSWLILFLISEPIQYNRLIIFFVVYGILIRYYDVFKNRAEKMYFS